jgi:CRP-like cAMP-binding protein
VEFPAGAELTREGESPKRVYAVTEGSARVEVKGNRLNVIHTGVGLYELTNAVDPELETAVVSTLAPET